MLIKDGCFCTDLEHSVSCMDVVAACNEQEDVSELETTVELGCQLELQTTSCRRICL